MKLASLYSTIKMMHGPINIKYPVIRIFCVSVWFAVPINLEYWSSTLLVHNKTDSVRIT